ncbi:hypothetical protein [Longimycelium tulufanense]|uniref:hypothetical protein n=1 Tax=Longimycelium tulufanense TaxID=907463 RepID=UPI00166A225E|nr:hypothetical protein [Longimycelium tulufanense]
MTTRSWRDREDAQRLRDAATRLREATDLARYRQPDHPLSEYVGYAVAELLDAVSRSLDTVGHDVRFAANGVADYILGRTHDTP